MNTLYIGVDFHSRQQTICYLKTDTGELVIKELLHKDKAEVRAFYQQFQGQGQVIVGLEASGYTPWFEKLLGELGHEVGLGDPTEIRRRARWRHKDDRRDTEHIWELMVHNEFPRLHQPTLESAEILRMLRYRQKLIKVRTLCKNSLQAIALQAGLAKASTCLPRPARQSSKPLRCHPSCNGNATTGSPCSSR
jgi:transposase